jgi:hypothetical protein
VASETCVSIPINKNILKTIVIHTGSRITLDSLKNMKNWNCLIEAIRKKTIALEKGNWRLEYTWIKAHTGHERNEPADKLAKEATRDSEICYSKFPRSEIEHQERERSIKEWQQLWDNTTKGTATKIFFPKTKDRLTHLHSNGNGPRKNEIIPTLIQDNRVTSISLCQR